MTDCGPDVPRLIATLEGIDGISAEITDTGGGCRAIEVRSSRIETVVLITNVDASLPIVSLEGDHEILAMIYADESDDDPRQIVHGRYASIDDAAIDLERAVRAWHVPAHEHFYSWKASDWLCRTCGNVSTDFCDSEV